jgi:hypothetical protein
MSSNTVRTAFRDAWATLTPTLPFVETINVPISDVDMEALPDLWGSIAFEATSNGPVTMGASPWYVENGTTSILVFGRSASGDSPAAAAAEDAFNAWKDWITSTGDIWVTRAQGPRPFSDAIVGNWLVLTVDLAYSFQHRP